MLLIAGCPDTGQPVSFLFEVSGRLEDERIREASGLARSQRQPGLLWVHNDRGNKPRVFATDATGAQLGRFSLDDLENNDWEDLASFTDGGIPYLAIAAIGDNDAEFDSRALYFVEEPDVEQKGRAQVTWTVNYRYPDGPRDAESAAIDVDTHEALVLSKRDVPPRLYSVPIRAGANETLEARYLGEVTSLDAPSRGDIEFAPKNKDWWWQPVGMDISADNRAAVVITYRSAYYYQRDAGQSWLDALNTDPLRISLGNLKNAEAVAFSDDARTVVVTGESEHSRILRVDLSEARRQ